MPQAYTLLIEGVVQIVIAIILFITVLRRGKNRIMTALAWFFIGVGIFSLGPFLPQVMKVIPGMAALIVYSSVVCHTSIFFGMAGYCGTQFGLLKGSKFVKASLVTGYTVAIALVVLHVLSLDSVSLAGSAKATVAQLSEWTMFAFFVISLVFITAVFLSLALQLRKEKGALNYAATTGLGLGLLLAALTIRKALDTMAPNLYVDLLSFVSLGLVVAGTTFQTSVSMSPGIVYDSNTKKPIANALIRILRLKDNKLLESRITKQDGRYGLLIEPGQYALNVSAAGYGDYRSQKMDINKPTLVGLDVGMQFAK